MTCRESSSSLQLFRRSLDPEESDAVEMGCKRHAARGSAIISCCDSFSLACKC